MILFDTKKQFVTVFMEEVKEKELIKAQSRCGSLMGLFVKASPQTVDVLFTLHSDKHSTLGTQKLITMLLWREIGTQGKEYREASTKGNNSGWLEITARALR